MKKFTIIFFATMSLVTTLSAHHMAQYEDAGIYIDEDSPHLLMTFY
jgi:hypothetical protein